MPTGAWVHNFPGSKDAHPAYINYPASGWDTLIAVMFHAIFTALDAIQDALGYDITGGHADLKTWIETLASLTVAETEVFNGNSPNPAAWTDLDLSGVVGSNPALALVKFWQEGGGMGPEAVAFRKDGDTDEFYDPLAIGCAAGDVAWTIHQVFLVATSPTGVIEWKFEAVGANCTIDIIAYIK